MVLNIVFATHRESTIVLTSYERNEIVKIALTAFFLKFVCHLMNWNMVFTVQPAIIRFRF